MSWLKLNSWSTTYSTDGGRYYGQQMIIQSIATFEDLLACIVYVVFISIENELYFLFWSSKGADGSA